MPYRNVYEEKNRRISGVKQNEEPEKDPKKIEAIYASQIPFLPGTEEFKARQRNLTAPNLKPTNGREVNSAEAKRFNRGI